MGTQGSYCRQQLFVDNSNSNCCHDALIHISSLTSLSLLLSLFHPHIKLPFFSTSEEYQERPTHRELRLLIDQSLEISRCCLNLPEGYLPPDNKHTLTAG